MGEKKWKWITLVVSQVRVCKILFRRIRVSVFVTRSPKAFLVEFAKISLSVEGFWCAANGKLWETEWNVENLHKVLRMGCGGHLLLVWALSTSCGRTWYEWIKIFIFVGWEFRKFVSLVLTFSLAYFSRIVAVKQKPFPREIRSHANIIFFSVWYREIAIFSLFLVAEKKKNSWKYARKLTKKCVDVSFSCSSIL